MSINVNRKKTKATEQRRATRLLQVSRFSADWKPAYTYSSPVLSQPPGRHLPTLPTTTATMQAKMLTSTSTAKPPTIGC